MIHNLHLEPGQPWPLGAHCDGSGINFALFSAHATRVELCVFDSASTVTYSLTRCTNQVWHGYLPNKGPGLQYAYRVYGPDGPEFRFDPDRLLLDPYARELSGVFSYDPAHAPEKCIKSCVPDDTFDWGDDRPPRIAWEDSVLYEIHVKGATRLHPGVPEPLRGTYAGLASPAMLDHFQQLGITAVNLLPVHCFLDEERLLNAGRRNYWGYNTIAFFAPEPRYAARLHGQSVLNEFRTMVRSLHTRNIEVILDVVFNHTAETDEFGPTLSFRGIDNSTYYRLQPDEPRKYENFSGCGNTLNVAHPRVLQLVMDSLRYWVTVMHVDGFRFDLAAALTRQSGFLAAIQQDPVLSRVKLIAEPWDLGPDGYQLGRFPPGWAEWNDRFRDDVRAFWLTGDVGAPALAQRIAGSSEVFNHSGRSPLAGLSFITAHDGFTLRDLVSYQHKHNDLNGENNRDGHGHNLSWNCGLEGDTSDPVITHRRFLLSRALLATLLIAQGVPMLQGGDEIGRTQSGNNNAYCQDNALTWLNWPSADYELSRFVAGLLALRKRFPQLRRTEWLTGAPDSSGRRDVVWWNREGREMTQSDWHAPQRGTLGLWLDRDEMGRTSRPVLILFNRDDHPQPFRIPPGTWQTECDSSSPDPFLQTERRGITSVAGRSVQILSQDS